MEQVRVFTHTHSETNNTYNNLIYDAW